MNNMKKNILYLVYSKGISRIGDVMFDYANNRFLAGINPTSLSLVAIYQSLESVIGVLFNLFGGVIADSFNRKKIIIATNILCGLSCITLSFISQEQWLVYAIVITNVILAFMSAFSGPSYKAFTKEIVKKDSISQLNSLLETTSTVIKVTIPMIAIFLYKLLGIHGVLLLDGLSFLIATSLIFFITPVNEEVETKENMTIRGIFDDLKIGFTYVYSHKQILIIIALSALVNFFLAAYNLLLPYSNQMFGSISSGLYGTFLTAEAIGGFIGAILSGFINKSLSSKRLMLFLAYSGLMLMLVAPLYYMFRNVIILAFSPALFSLFLSIFNIQFFSIVQRDVDNEFLGRVFGIIFTVAILFMPLGTVFFSVVLNPNNTFNLFIIGVSITILSLIFSTLLKRYDRN
ncbi:MULTISPECIES: MFS transporter [Streptococcus]|jgi:transporter, major facilitator family protein|uniref:MFS transporter n=3 Tax=Streptococcus TaxID=1301 RepID=A0A1X1G2P7_STROR|nr:MULTISPECIES: MFS transporter [Streptococcus]HEN2608066.1 MFS transporter [Streptococcus agalactiae]HEQ4302930.1 MFS transporter [Streptococcus pyogenes]HEU8173620.1 MFS transporter [Streptococcus pneumoniae]AIK77692.1 macrolide ABC transporter permease [Streptococcus anginosus]MBW7663143.1 MFS transporter [Streptococcus gordonii]